MDPRSLERSDHELRISFFQELQPRMDPPEKQKVTVIAVVSNSLRADPSFGVKCLSNPPIHFRFVVHAVES